ncbi:MAG: hypothetical protein ACYCSA_08995 [Thermoplasmataceae archaeon]
MELIDIFDWSRKKSGLTHSSDMWLIGGWAVDAYNPWFGSRDIDIMARPKVVTELKKYLYSKKRYSKYRGPDGKIRLYKQVGKEQIELDFVNSRQNFEGTTDMISMTISPENSVSLDLTDKTNVVVPERSILLGMKIKAAWDRNFLLKAGKYYDRSYLQDKISKDYGDIIALLDDVYIRNNPLKLQYLHDEIFSKNYLRNLLKSLTIQDLKSFQYRTMNPKDCKELIDRLLSVT